MKTFKSIEALESRIAPAFSGVVNLAILTGSAGGQPGFRLDGDLDGDNSGYSVADAGDFNGDGFHDLLIGAPGVDVNGNNSNGAAYVIFGAADGFGATVDLTNLPAAKGFKVTNDMYNGARFGSAVAGAGDVNGDGYDDVLIGASSATQNGFVACGATAVLFGSATPGSVPKTLSAINGTNGYIMAGNGLNGEFTGSSLGAAGDVNGDGYSDYIIGAPGHDITVNGQVTADAVGGAYVVYGSNAVHNKLNFLSLLGTGSGDAGFLLEGVTQFDQAGNAVSGIGDFNGDGFDDLLIGAEQKDGPGAGQAGGAYVVFGKAANFAAKSSLGSFSGTAGGQFLGIATTDGLGASVSGAGDVNGDGLADLIIGAAESNAKANNSGEAYVVFGKTSTIGNVSIANANLRLQGSAADSMAGMSVSSAGDFNGDGLDDLLVGVPGPTSTQGSAYIVFGKTAYDSPIVLDSLDGTAGFKLRGLNTGDVAGTSVHAAGDVNGDGYGDIIIGAPNADHGVTDAGESYVVFGGNGGNAVTIGADHKTATYTDVDGDLVKIKVNKGELTADMFQLTGANALGGAKLSKINLAGHDDLAGANFTISAKPQLIGGALHGDRLADVGFFDASDVTLGKVSVGGDVGQLRVTTAKSFSANSLGVNGLDPHAGAPLFAGFSAIGTLGSLAVKTRVDDVSLFAGRIGNVKVGGDIADSKLLIGGSTQSVKIGGDFDHSTLQIGASPFGNSADVKLGSMKVRGDWIASSLTAGITTGADTFFGTNDDSVYSGGQAPVLSKIANIIIGGQARGTFEPGGHFAIEAESIGSVKIGGAKVKLSKTVAGDLLLGSTGDFRLHEIA